MITLKYSGWDFDLMFSSDNRVPSKGETICVNEKRFKVMDIETRLSTMGEPEQRWLRVDDIIVYLEDL